MARNVQARTVSRVMLRHRNFSLPHRAKLSRDFVLMAPLPSHPDEGGSQPGTVLHHGRPRAAQWLRVECQVR